MFLSDTIKSTVCSEGWWDPVSILSDHNIIRSVIVIHIEVKCCSEGNYVLNQALEKAKKEIPVTEYTVSVNGQVA